MKYKSLLIVLFISYYYGHSQSDNQSKITYTMTFNFEVLENKLEGLSLEMKDKFKKRIENSDDLKFHLFYENDKSIYYQSEEMENEGRTQRNMLNRLAGKGVYYSEMKNEMILNEKESFGEQFIVNIPKINWKLSNETKMIGKYKCYKAKSTLIIENSSGIHETPLIAWCTTQISSGFGPKNYNNLPGLILQLYERTIVITATKIELNIRDKVTIIKPSKGEKLSLVEFNQKAKDIYSGNN